MAPDPYSGPRVDPYPVANPVRTQVENVDLGLPPAKPEVDTKEYWKARALEAESINEQTKRNLQRVQQRIMEAGMAVVQEFIDETL